MKIMSFLGINKT